MRILGIDPGTAITGYGIVDEIDKKIKLVEYGVIRTSPKQTASERLEIIAADLKKVINDFKPDHCAVEKLFFSTNAKTAIKVGEARGVILLTIVKENILINEYTPLEVKLAITGYGKADKKQIQYMVKNLLKLQETPQPDDAADALAIAICHINSWRLKNLK